MTASTAADTETVQNPSDQEARADMTDTAQRPQSPATDTTEATLLRGEPRASGRVSALLADMTLDEKLAQLVGWWVDQGLRTWRRCRARWPPRATTRRPPDTDSVT